jgi:inner membrane protein
MVKISKGWYIITEEDGQLYFNDLRFGLLGLDSDSDFVFKYHIGTDADGKTVLTEVKKTQVDAKKVLGDLWQGIQGN